jgi:Uma2 family endonuclease
MAESARRPRYSLGEYVILEEMSNVRHEYLDGQIFAMAGGTPEHGGLCANLMTLLSNALAGRPCRVFTSDVRVRVRATGLDTYPDASVVCGRAERDTDDPNALTNPLVLVEVTSPGTEAYDRGEKLEHYRKIPSLQEVLIVAHAEVGVDVWRRRSGEDWAIESAGPAGSARLRSLSCELPVAEIYRNPLSPDAPRE